LRNTRGRLARITSILWRCLPPLGLLGLLSLPVQAQQREIVLPKVEGGRFKRINIQVLEPGVETPTVMVREGANQGRETLARDLIYSGMFYVTDSFGSPYLPDGVARAWNARPEAGEKPYRIDTIWKPERDGLSVEMRLFDALQTQVVGKHYQVDAGGVRGAMHHFADEVIRRLTGVDGVAQTKIAYSYARGEVSEIWAVDYDGFGKYQLTNHNTLALSPVWGKGRRWLTFTSYYEGQPHLYRVDEGSNMMRAVSKRDGLNTAPDWTSARQLYAVTLSKDGNAEIYAIDKNGKNPKRLTFHQAIDTSPSWSPKGDQIAFTSDRSGVPQIYVMDGDGGNMRRLTYHNRYSDSPAWSPNGQWIAYVARWEGDIELRLMKPDGTTQRVIVTEGLNDGPTWAKDSRHIAFSSLRGGSRAVYVVDIYTGMERRLTSGPNDAITPAWSQD
jgi:TolB protein